MRFRHLQGMTLLELLIALCIFAILIGVALPSFDQLLEKHRQHAQLNELFRMIQLARANAVNGGKTITLCGSQDGSTCTANWLNPFVLVFEDSDRNYQLDEGEVLIRSNNMGKGRWHWRGSANRPYLRFRSDGSAIEWGRFTRCPKDPASDELPQLVLNRVGRTYSTSTTRSNSESETTPANVSTLCI